MTRVAVLGAGNGGLAAVADLVSRGHTVRLWNRGESAIAAIAAAGGVRYQGVFGEGFAPVERATTHIDEAIYEASVLLVCLPAFAHGNLAGAMAPFLRPEQLILLDPGALLGSVAVARTLREAGYEGALQIAETSTLSYICRKTADDAVRITSVASDLPFAALPGHRTAELAADLHEVLPGLRPVDHVLTAGIASINTVLHPPGMILGAAWIEHTGGDLAYYADMAVPSVARLMARLDDERLAVAAAWGIETEPFLEAFARIGSTSPEAAASGDFLRALEDSEPNRSIRAPTSLDTRYLHEDIPYGVVPLADLGTFARVPTPTLDAVIAIASVIAGRDYRAEGRTLTAVGLQGRSPLEIVEQLLVGDA